MNSKDVITSYSIHYTKLYETYITNILPVCFRLLTHEIRFARFLALPSVGSNMEARIAIIA